MQNELTPQEQAVEAKNNQYAQAESNMYDDGNSYDPNASEIDNMVGSAEIAQPDNEILDFEANEQYSNVYLYDLFNNLAANADKLRDTLNNEVQIDFVKRDQMRALHEVILKLDDYIKTLKVYIDNMLSSATYKKNIYSYLTFRNCYLVIVKTLKKVLDI